jgi:lipid-binding SYLF domain-containing protein
MTVASNSSLVSSSLREQASQRAAAALMGQQQRQQPQPYGAHDYGGGDSRGHNDRTHSLPSTIVVGGPSRATAWSTPPSNVLAGGGGPHESTSAAPQQRQQQQQAPAVPSAATTAADARREWQQHGTGRTQVLQDQANVATSQGQVMGRVVSHVPRFDLAGSAYTAYVLNVTGPVATTTSNAGSASWQMERRYSDFHKLHALLQLSCPPQVASNVSRFPSKHWSSTKLVKGWSASTDMSRQLVQDRTVQLDVWLVQVMTEYNRGSLDAASRQAVYDFLCTSVPPCDRDTSGGSRNTSAESATDDLYAQHRSLPSSGAKAGPGREERIKYHNPWTTTLGSSLRQAVQTIEQLTNLHVDSSIPLDLLHAAQGLLFLTVVKGGMVFSGRVGTGILVARREDENAAYMDSLHRRVGAVPAVSPQPPACGWSAPCALSVLGMGWGALVGGDVTHYLVVLTSRKATMDLVSSTRLQLGAELGVAVGPVGRGANSHLQTGDWTVHPAYAYAISHGLFVGMSLEGSVLRVRDDVNAVFYGRPISAPQILHHPPVKAAEPLYRAIDRAMQAEIPHGAFRPSEYFTSSSKGSSSRGVNQASAYGDSHIIYNGIQPQQPPYPQQAVPNQAYATPSPSWASASHSQVWGT